MNGVAALALVAGPGVGLVLSAPSRPGRPVADRVNGVADQLGEQAADLVDGQRNQQLSLHCAFLALAAALTCYKRLAKLTT
jgi:hypothetical protein